MLVSKGADLIFSTVLLCTLAASVNTFTPSLDTRVRFSSDSGNVAVYDKAMPEWLTTVAEQNFKIGDRWLYQHPDELANIAPREPGNRDWSSPISPDYFVKSKLWIVFRKLVEDFAGSNEYMPYQISGVMLRRGDSPTLVRGEVGSNDVFCMLFLSKGKTPNSEIQFFSGDAEILQAVKKKFNRIVMWNASLAYNIKQPGFQTFKTEYSLLIKMSKVAKKVQDELQYVQAVREKEKMQKLDNFPTFTERGTQYTDDFFEKHLTRKFYDANGYVISMFDGIMNETELATLRSYLIKHNTAYSNTGFSTKEDDDSDNVSWIAMFLPEILNNTKILDLVKGMARYLSGEDDWYPYDVSLNMIQKTFHTRIHEDCEAYEHEYTFLLYLNPNWNEEMYGETIFLNQIQNLKLGKKKKVVQDKAYETIVSVKPKYGRMVMFRNIIPHSARPPSPSFHGTRYTFAVKVSRSKLIGLAKILRELLEFKQGSKDDGGQLYETVSNMAQTSDYSISVDAMIDNIRKYRQVKHNELDNQGMKFLTTMLRKVYIGENQPSV